MSDRFQILSAGDDFRIAFFDRGSSRVVVSFNHIGVGLNDRGFGFEFLEKSNISHVSVSCRMNTHYQQLSLEEVEKAIRPVRRQVDDVVSYGSSLGGYAAIYFSGALDSRVLAFSPRLLPHDYMRGYRVHVEGVPIRHPNITDIALSPKRHTVIFDPLNGPDKRFVALFCKPEATDWKFVPLRATGHKTAAVLAEAGKLSGVVRGFLDTGEVALSPQDMLDIEKVSPAVAGKAEKASAAAAPTTDDAGAAPVSVTDKGGAVRRSDTEITLPILREHFAPLRENLTSSAPLLDLAKGFLELGQIHVANRMAQLSLALFPKDRQAADLLAQIRSAHRKIADKANASGPR